MRRNYSKKVADKLAYLTKTSLKVLSKHFASASTDAKMEEGIEENSATSIVFILTAYLSIPDIEVSLKVIKISAWSYFENYSSM